MSKFQNFIRLQREITDYKTRRVNRPPKRRRAGRCRMFILLNDSAFLDLTDCMPDDMPDCGGPCRIVSRTVPHRVFVWFSLWSAQKLDAGQYTGPCWIWRTVYRTVADVYFANDLHCRIICQMCRTPCRMCRALCRKCWALCRMFQTICRMCRTLCRTLCRMYPALLDVYFAQKSDAGCAGPLEPRFKQM